MELFVSKRSNEELELRFAEDVMRVDCKLVGMPRCIRQ